MRSLAECFTGVSSEGRAYESERANMTSNLKVLGRAALAAFLVLGMQSGASATVYRGFPHLHLTMAVVDAGGGAAHFDSHRLVQTLAGAEAQAENAKLIHQYGASRVDSFYSVFTFAVDDAMKKAHNMLIPLPKSPHPDPHDGKALATALYDAGVTPSGRYDVGYMLEELVSHQIHHDIMGDMDRQFTPSVNADFHVILTTAMHDLKKAYGISPA